MFVINEECDLDDLGNGVKRKILAHAGGLMSVEVHFEHGAVGPLHNHPHEQLTYVLSGVFDFTIWEVTRQAGIQIISATLMDEWREVANC